LDFNCERSRGGGTRVKDSRKKKGMKRKKNAASVILFRKKGGHGAKQSASAQGGEGDRGLRRRKRVIDVHHTEKNVLPGEAPYKEGKIRSFRDRARWIDRRGKE